MARRRMVILASGIALSAWLVFRSPHWERFVAPSGNEASQRLPTRIPESEVKASAAGQAPGRTSADSSAPTHDGQRVRDIEPAARPAERKPAERPDELPLPKDPLFGLLDNQFQSEPIDPDWSDRTAAAILAKIATTHSKAGYVVVQADCRTTLCRVELHLAGTSVDKSFDTFSIAATFQGSAVRTAIEQSLDLDAVVSDSGAIYGLPTFLMYLRRAKKADREHVSGQDSSR